MKQEPGSRSSTWWFVAASVVAALYFARAFLLPVALAVLLAFVLSPLVRRLSRTFLSRTAATVLTMVCVASLIGALGWMLVFQVRGLGDNLAEYRTNLRAKIVDVRTSLGHHVQEATTTVRELTDELAHPVAPAATSAKSPIVLTQRAPDAPDWGLVQGAVGSMADFISLAVVTFLLCCVLLLRWEDLHRRVLTLVEEKNRDVAARVFEEASGRVSGYLGRQLLVNAIHGTAMGLILWWIGVPSPLLWGVLGGSARFLPYLGPLVSTAAPILLSFASSPNWSQAWVTTGALLLLELVTNNVLEPLLYCSLTGLSPFALLVSAVFWTWVWGPLGLVISTPLTVCLLVAGKHVPALRVFEVMCGEEPVPTRRRKSTHRAEKNAAVDRPSSSP